MPKLILGPLQSGKTTYILNDIKKRMENGCENMIILVPEQSTMTYEREVLRVLGNRAGAHVEVLSFLRFARLMFSKYEAAGGVYANASSKQLIMSLALSGVREELTVFRAAAHKSEFARTMISAVNDLKTYNITPERLNAAAEKCGGRICEKLRDTALIYAAYEALLGRAYRDPSDDLTRLARLMSGQTELPWTFYIDAFFGFTPQEYLVVEELIRLCDGLTAAFSYTREHTDNPLFSMTKHTLGRIMTLFERYDRKPEIINTEKKSVRPPELDFLSEAFAAGGETKYEGGASAVTAVSANGTGGEAEYLCDWISKRIYEGARYSDFLVLAADMDAYALTLGTAFEKYGIPVYADEKRSVSDMAPVRAVLYALSAAQKNFAYSELFAHLKLIMGNYTYEEICALENYVLMWGITGQKLSKPFTRNPFSRKKDGDGEEKLRADKELRRLNDIRERALEPLFALASAISGERTYEKIAEAVFKFMTESGFSDAVERASREYSRAGDMRRADEYLRIYNAVTEALDEIVTVLSDAPCTAGGFLKLFELALSEHKLGALPPAADCVSFSSFDRVISPDAPFVAVIGASDANIPRINRGGGLFDEAEREELAGIGLEISKTAYENASYELFLVYCALCAPKKELLITYPLMEDDGSEASPSKVLSSAWERLSSLKTARAEDTPAYERLYSPSKARELVLASFSKDAGGDEKERAVVEAANEALSIDESWPALRESVRAYVTSDNEAVINSESGRERMMSKSTMLSASRIEKFYGCRFSYYLNYVLGIKKPERPEFTPADTGKFIHYILEAFFLKIMRGKRPIGEYSEAETDEIVASCIKEYISAEIYLIDERSARFEYLFSRLVRSLKPIISNLLDEFKVTSFIPQDVELEISADERLASATGSGDISVRLYGIVDRVDVYRKDGKTYLRVIDYKTGKKKFDLGDVAHGINMQMLLYLFAVTENYKKTTGDADSAGVLYFNAYEPVISAPKTIDDEKLMAERDKALKRNGLVRSDYELIVAMDRTLETGGSSRYIPVALKDREPTKTSSAASRGEFELIEKGVKRTVTEMAEALRAGSIEINPYERPSGERPCRYCEYKSVCRFDETRGNRPRKLLKLKKAEIYRMFGGESDGNRVD